MMSDLIKRMDAALRLDVMNGDAFERAIMGAQFREARDRIAKLEQEVWLGDETIADANTHISQLQAENKRLHSAMEQARDCLNRGFPTSAGIILCKALEDKADE